MTIVYGDGYLINYDTIDRLWVGKHKSNGADYPALMMEKNNEREPLFFGENSSYMEKCFSIIKSAVVHGDSYCELPAKPDDGSMVIYSLNRSHKQLMVGTEYRGTALEGLKVRIHG